MSRKLLLRCNKNEGKSITLSRETAILWVARVHSRLLYIILHLIISFSLNYWPDPAKFRDIIELTVVLASCSYLFDIID